MEDDKPDPDLHPRQTVITKDNVLVSASVVASAIGVTIIVMLKLNSIENRLDRMNDRWTLPQMREYNYRAWRQNPTLNLPDPDQIHAQIP